jgi:hypothetical protein
MKKKTKKSLKAGAPKAAGSAKPISLTLTKKALKIKVSKRIATAAVGNVVPINLTLGRGFDKSDKIIITAWCCGPQQQHCPSFWTTGP